MRDDIENGVVRQRCVRQELGRPLIVNWSILSSFSLASRLTYCICSLRLLFIVIISLYIWWEGVAMHWYSH
jgi:hypothetical protein